MVYGIAPLVRTNDLTDISLKMQREDAGGVTTVFASPTEYLYVGFARRFDALMSWMVDINSNLGEIHWEFSIENSLARSSDWVEFIPLQPDIHTFSSAREYAYWDIHHPSFEAWSPIELVDGDGQKYWIRIRSSLTSSGNTLSALTIRPYALIPTSEVKNQLQRPEDFSYSHPPHDLVVEDHIREAESELFRATEFSYRPEFVEDELVNFKTYGMTLRHRPILDFKRLEVWTGSGWDTKEEGRNSDYNIDPITGVIYLSTIFLGPIPPSLRRGWSERRNQGSFKRGVRVSYVHGRDPRIDSFFPEVVDIITKHACVDIATNYDFAQLLPTSVDRISLEKKIEIWNEDIDEFVNKYTKLTMY